MSTKWMQGKSRLILWLAGAAVFVTGAVVMARLSRHADGSVLAGAGALPGAGAAGVNSQGAQPGFRITLPQGWHAAAQQDGAVVARSGDGASAVVIAPAPGAGALSPAAWLRQRGASALDAYLKGAQIETVTGRSATIALASVNFNSGAGKAAAICSFPAGPPEPSTSLPRPGPRSPPSAPALFASCKASRSMAKPRPHRNPRPPPSLTRSLPIPARAHSASMFPRAGKSRAA